MRFNIDTKKLFLYGFIASAMLTGASLYFQFVVGLTPCPLCIVQRLAVFLIAITMCIGFFIRTRLWQKVIAGMSGVFTALGLFASGNQIYLQTLPPDQVPSCGPGLNYMLENFPLTEVVYQMLSGSGECAKVQWQLMGLSMPTWTMMCFVGFMILNTVILFRK